MKRATAIKHLCEMAAEASDQARFRDTDIGWPLDEMWLTGELLESDGEVEVGSVILLLDVAPVELPWMALHGAGEAVGHLLRLGKRPMLWTYRPALWPSWNARNRRVVRFWTFAEGLDEELIEGLRAGCDVPIVEPSDAVMREQLEEELSAARVHLRQVVDGHWDYDQSRDRRRGQGENEEKLWRAASGLIEIEDALTELTS